ncbi:hypothetical protein I5M27_00065 [Adhaeribacter sp. BT258]|uniref:Alpha/beta hydrolase n=1 Tax=Adhaeribacter terrigena TaxID=2793070 RepID=A0ABS1BWC2_9BACT|nr:hypothetical protein [Adhaeribacter terrigena]MBK0401357.1 hypothetical protein [Adhaeribacter terrigena]
MNFKISQQTMRNSWKPLRILLLLSGFFIFFNGNSYRPKAAEKLPFRGPELTSDTLLKFSARPEAGFNFGYFLYLPKGLKSHEQHYLMVETTNTGLNDSIEFHEKGAQYAAGQSSVGNYTSRKLQIPLLVPIFPRSITNWELYTHALDRETLLSQDAAIKRLDLQLLAMIKDARKQLKQRGFPVKDKFFMNGFSASGTFANRFSMLHPEKIKAMAAGGINAIPILPVSQLKETPLNYPLGIADVKKITGREVNLKAFNQLPKMLFMGALDENDAVAFDDAYSAEDREKVYALMGKQLVPQRWEFVQEIYSKQNVKTDFRTYSHMGHGTDKKINNELVEFFRKHMEDDRSYSKTR